MRYYSRIPFLLLTVGLLASVWTAQRRIAVERAGRTVELTVDMEQLRQLAFSLGVPLPEALDRLKAVGVTSVALAEQPLSELETDGIVPVRQAAGALPPGVTEVRIPDEALYRQVAAALQIRVRSSGSRAASSPGSRSVLLRGPRREELVIPAGWSTVRGIPIGLAAEEVALAREHRLGVVGRVSNFPAADEAAIRAVAQRLRDAGAHTVVFAGEEVLGNRDRIKETAAALDAQGLRYGSVEFGKQMGDDTLSRALQARIVRVHSIQNAEIQKLDVGEVVDRFVKAAEERNIRLLYVRLLPHVSERPFEDNLAYIHSMADGLRQRGLTLGIAQPFEPVYAAPEPGRGSRVARLRSRLVPALSALAVAGAAALLLAGIVWLPPGKQARLALLAGAAAGAMVLGGGDLGRKLVALAGAMLFPALAFVWYAPGVMEREGGGDRAPGAANGSRPSQSRPVVTRPRSPFRQFAMISAVSLMGALTVVGLLSERQFMVKVSAFMGIKAAHFLPLLVVAVLYAIDAMGGPRPWAEVRLRAQENLSRLLGERLQLWHLVVGLVALVAVGLLLARTGNDPGVGVSGTEMSVRNLLDQYLVRPRTKEFLIGHPALLAALLLASIQAGRGWVLPLAIIGSIGQVSMVNSFCHLHTPLLMTVARTFNGLWLGLLFGLLVTRLLKRWLPALAQMSTPEPGRVAAVGGSR